MNRISMNGVVYESEASMSMINNKVVCEGDLYINGVKQGQSEIKDSQQITKSYNLDGIKSVYNSSFKLIVDVNPQHLTEEVIITASESAHKNIVVNFNRSILMLDGKGAVGRPEITVKAKSLEKLVNGATNDIIATIETNKIKIENDGVGNISIKGTVGEVIFENSGVGNIQALDLLSDKASFENSGVGNLKFTTHKLIDGENSGVGNVKYHADNEVRVSNSGVGNIKYLGAKSFPSYDNSAQTNPSPLKVEIEVKKTTKQNNPTNENISFEDMVDSVKKSNQPSEDIDKVKGFTDSLTKKFKKFL